MPFPKIEPLFTHRYVHTRRRMPSLCSLGFHVSCKPADRDSTNLVTETLWYAALYGTRVRAVGLVGKVRTSAEKSAVEHNSDRCGAVGDRRPFCLDNWLTNLIDTTLKFLFRSLSFVQQDTTDPKVGVVLSRYKN